MIYLNKKAFAALGEPEAVEFLFNPATESIGLRPANPRLESAFPVKPKVIQGLHSGYVIHASAFMVDIKIHPARTIQFNKITVDSKGLMTLPLESITAIARGAR
ncbi:MAG TPA: hypothetical protein VGO43_02895 [Pyrinomonadaceae bacterium]|nr:hypothetical protein [Pyrinomonadaceae bacterium]